MSKKTAFCLLFIFFPSLVRRPSHRRLPERCLASVQNAQSCLAQDPGLGMEKTVGPRDGAKADSSRPCARSNHPTDSRERVGREYSPVSIRLGLFAFQRPNIDMLMALGAFVSKWGWVCDPLVEASLSSASAIRLR